MVTYVILGLVLALFVNKLRNPHPRFWAVVRAVRVRHFVNAVPWLVATVVAVAALNAVPALSWGWWSALGGSGNVAAGQTDESAAAATLIGVVVLGLMVFIVPSLAMDEEEIFRRGAEDRSVRENVFSALCFGVSHMLMGVSLGTSLALSIGGWYFTRTYLAAHRSALSDALVSLDERAAALQPAWCGPRSMPDGWYAARALREARAESGDTAVVQAAAAHAAWNWTLAAFLIVVQVVSLAV